MRKVTLDAYAHQDLPFEKLVEELQPERSTSHTPLFQIVFVLQNARGTVLQENSELTARRVPTESNRVAFDLLVTLEEASEGLFVSTRFKQALFDGSTIARLAGHFENLLAGLVADPERRLSDLPRLTPPERHQLLVEWRDTRTDYPRDRCLRELFDGAVGGGA